MAKKNPWRHQNERAVQKWAREILRCPERHVIIDTETTGRGNSDEVVEICAMRLDSEVLLNQRIRPTEKRSIPVEAREVHGISMADLQDAPTIDEIEDAIFGLFTKYKVLIYNAVFDLRLLRQSLMLARCDPRQIKLMQADCVMLAYARWKGRWNHRFEDWRWPKLAKNLTRCARRLSCDVGGADRDGGGRVAGQATGQLAYPQLVVAFCC